MIEYKSIVVNPQDADKKMNALVKDGFALIHFNHTGAANDFLAVFIKMDMPKMLMTEMEEAMKSTEVLPKGETDGVLVNEFGAAGSGPIEPDTGPKQDTGPELGEDERELKQDTSGEQIEE